MQPTKRPWTVGIAVVGLMVVTAGCNPDFSGYFLAADGGAADACEAMTCEGMSGSCGELPDGCGNTLVCECEAGRKCQASTCVADCGTESACSTPAATACADGMLRTCQKDVQGCLVWSAATACGDGFCGSATQCGQCSSSCPSNGATECNDGKSRTCVADAHGCLSWAPEQACASGTCADAQRCTSCIDECPTLGDTSCVAGDIRSCAAETGGCKKWSAATHCPTGACAADGKSCASCGTAVCQSGASECQDGSIRVCTANTGGCLAWGAFTPCSSGFCADATSCGGCMNTCATLGATSCQGGRLRACVADGGGCLSWGAESVCADGFCASTSACGVCNSDCAAVGTTSCQSGQLQTCLADSNGCLRWNVPTRCASGSCEDATSCSCTAETDIVFCSRLGRSCGSVTDVDNCGSPRTVSCGLCAEGTCNLSGVCVAADYEWTRWRVPPDAPPASNYQISGGVVTDAVTGLQWQRSISTEEYLWEDAKSYCAGSWLDGGGWRLPTVVELQSIVDFGRYDPAIDPMAFPNTPPDSFWTSSVLVGHFNDAWVVYFAYGTVAYDNGLLDDNWVRCVR